MHGGWPSGAPEGKRVSFGGGTPTWMNTQLQANEQHENDGATDWHDPPRERKRRKEGGRRSVNGTHTCRVVFHATPLGLLPPLEYSPPHPVFPLVASITVEPLWSFPCRSASRSIASARRSFTDDIGLNDSHFT
eukprot:GHVU01211010.1.p2 GENE.GHVU01211010.1~~GHVU01211010.1.p2  ORF type:complete len:134 (+),score=7.39 GHVU01211010.1:570-971(+)